jgi:hypothetical protein
MIDQGHLRNGDWRDAERDDAIRHTPRCGGRALVGDATKVVSIHLRKGVRILSFYDAL